MKQNSPQRKIKQNTKREISMSSLRMLREVLADARRYLEQYREDLNLFQRFGTNHSDERQVLNPFQHLWQFCLKRIVDIVAVIVCSLFFAPAMLMVAVAVKATSQGPILYSQERVGKDGVIFTIYKFRTMRTDAEKESGPMWATENDPRLTPIGKFLRKSHLDELPQLINVLRGEMSLVGPRPERPYFVKKLSADIPYYAKRLCVKPGITGLAQVRHKYDETIADVKKKVRYDIMYMRKMCLMLDIKVLFWTIGVIFTGKGAR